MPAFKPTVIGDPELTDVPLTVILALGASVAVGVTDVCVVLVLVSFTI